MLRLITVLFLLPFTGCLFEDVKNAVTSVENYSQIHFQQKYTDNFQWCDTDNTGPNGGVVCYSSYLDVLQNQTES